MSYIGEKKSSCRWGRASAACQGYSSEHSKRALIGVETTRISVCVLTAPPAGYTINAQIINASGAKGGETDVPWWSLQTL